MGKRVGKPKPQKNTRMSWLIAFGDRLLEHQRLLWIVIGAVIILLGTVFTSIIDYEDTIPVTAHYEQYSVQGGKRDTHQIKLYFSDHEPLVFGYKSTSRDMQAQIRLIPPGEELHMRLHPVTHEILALAEDDRVHFTFEQSYHKSTSVQLPTGVGLCLILLAIFGKERKI